MLRKRTSDSFDATGAAVAATAGGAKRQEPAATAAATVAAPTALNISALRNASRIRVNSSGTVGSTSGAEARAPLLPAAAAAAQAESTAAATPQPLNQHKPDNTPSSFITYANALFTPAAASDDAQLQQRQERHNQLNTAADKPLHSSVNTLKAVAAFVMHAEAAALPDQHHHSLKAEQEGSAALDNENAETAAATLVPSLSAAAAGPRYAFDPDSGLLLRTGEGEGRARHTRRFVEDWRTGNFYPLHVLGGGGGGGGAVADGDS